ncbi:MAG: hypothetical protein QM747_03290 [Nocardioides sp.]
MSQSLALEARNRYGAVKRHHPQDLELVAAAQRDLAAAKIEDFIQRTVDDAPPLTDEQRNRLAALLRPVAGGGDAA